MRDIERRLEEAIERAEPTVQEIEAELEREQLERRVRRRVAIFFTGYTLGAMTVAGWLALDALRPMG